MIRENLAKSFEIKWPVSDEAEAFVRSWAEKLYIQCQYHNKRHGEDFFTDFELNEIGSKDQIIVTRWIDPPEKSFYCISGWALYDIFPWWNNMHAYFESQGLTPWLPFPCLLLSRSHLSRHADIGRPTALNYPIFGENSMTGYFWESKEGPDKDFLFSYRYQKGKTWLLNTTAVHGGLPDSEENNSELRSICNMGFAEDFETCLRVLNSSSAKELFGVD